MAAPYSPQTEALRQRLAQPAGAPSPFARGGTVTQLPTGRGEQIGSIASGVGAQVGKQVAQSVGKTAAQSAATTGASAASSLAGAAGSMGVSMATDYLASKLKPKEDMPTFGGANGQYLDQYGRRFEGTGPGIAGGAVKGAGYGTMVMPGVGTAIGAGVGALIGAFTKNAGSANTDFRVEDAAQAIKDAYKGELGREASDDEVMSQLVGQGWDPKGGDRWVGEKGINSVLDIIRASPEAQAYRAAQAGAAAPEAGAAAAAPADPLGRGGVDPFSTGTQALRAQLAGGEPVARTGLESRSTGVRAGDVASPGDFAAAADALAGGAPQSGQVATTTAPAEWNTDGYAAPAIIAQNVSGKAPAGWDQDKWNDPNHQTPKYVWGRITQDDNPNDVEQLLAAYPGATFDGKDKVTGIPGLGPIDIYKGASVGENTPQWLDMNAAAAEGGNTSAAPNSSPALIDATGGPSNQQDVMALIAQLIGREGQKDAGGLTQALMNQLRATA